MYTTHTNKNNSVYPLTPSTCQRFPFSFKKLQKAYSVLSDPRQRNLYHKGQMSDG